MSRLSSRATLQVIVLTGIAVFAMLTGWACGCGSGSDHTYGSGVLTTRDAVTADGEVNRWHDFSQGDFATSTKDLQTFYNFIEQGGSGFGVLVPQAPGATQPGLLSGSAEPDIFVHWTDEAGAHYLSVPLTTSQELADDLTALIPPPPETRWQALVPIPGDWMTEIPTQTTSIENMWGHLHYGIDFQGTELCNHCEVKLTTCSITPLTTPQRFLLGAFGGDSVISSDGINCAQPISTYILLSDDHGAPVPGSVFASFGPFGGMVYTSTMQSDLNIPYALRHSAQTTQTLTLSPIVSEQGWQYSWADLAGNPITQTIVGPMGNDLWGGSFYEDNLQVVVSDLPTCVHRSDTIYLTATMVTTPTIQATAHTVIDVLPDPNLCTVIDLGIDQIASTAEISAGNWVTFTFTITNFEITAQNAVITQTITPASAIGDASLPVGCTRTSGEIVCPVGSVPAGGNVSLEISIQAAATFSGSLGSVAQVQPLTGADLHYYDNITRRLSVNVVGGSTPILQIFLPFVQRR